LRPPPRFPYNPFLGAGPPLANPEKEAAMENRDELVRHVKTVSLVGASIIISLFLYLGIEEFIRARFKPFHGFLAVTDLQRLRYAFFALAIVAVIFVRVLRQIMLRRASGKDERTALHRLQRASLLTLVLSEVPAIAGLVLFLIGGLNVDFYLLLLASMLLLFMYFPRRSAWEDWLS
jgi:hypothetical protein